MQISRSFKKHNAVDYYLLQNGYADVFMHRNEKKEVDEDGGIEYVAEEVYFKILSTVTKKEIESNFVYMWEDAEKIQMPKPNLNERLKALEMAILEVI